MLARREEAAGSPPATTSKEASAGRAIRLRSGLTSKDEAQKGEKAIRDKIFSPELSGQLPDLGSVGWGVGFRPIPACCTQLEPVHFVPTRRSKNLAISGPQVAPRQRRHQAVWLKMVSSKAAKMTADSGELMNSAANCAGLPSAEIMAWR